MIRNGATALSPFYYADESALFGLLVYTNTMVDLESTNDISSQRNALLHASHDICHNVFFMCLALNLHVLNLDLISFPSCLRLLYDLYPSRLCLVPSRLHFVSVSSPSPFPPSYPSPSPSPPLLVSVFVSSSSRLVSSPPRFRAQLISVSVSVSSPFRLRLRPVSIPPRSRLRLSRSEDPCASKPAAKHDGAPSIRARSSRKNALASARRRCPL